MGIDTYINIYINTYEYIFLSFLHRGCMGCYERHVFISYTDFARQTRQLGEEEKCLFVPLP